MANRRLALPAGQVMNAVTSSTPNLVADKTYSIQNVTDSIIYYAELSTAPTDMEALATVGNIMPALAFGRDVKIATATPLYIGSPYDAAAVVINEVS